MYIKENFFFQYSWKGRCYWGNLYRKKTIHHWEICSIIEKKKKNYLLNTWFWNDYSALHYTLLMIKKSKLIVDVNEAFGAPLIYLFKTFNWKSIRSFRLSKTYHLRSCIVVFYHHSHLQVVKWLIIKSQPAHKSTQFVAKSPEKLSIPLSGWYLEYRTTLNLH